ncbi:hypothetical protein Tco_0845445 [Tanacetum coccineum]
MTPLLHVWDRPELRLSENGVTTITRVKSWRIQLKHQWRLLQMQLLSLIGQVICVKYDGFKVVSDGDYMQKLVLLLSIAIGYKDIERASEEALGITSLVIYEVFQKVGGVVHQLGHSSEPDWSSSGLCSIKFSTAPLHMEGSSIMLYGIYI